MQNCYTLFTLLTYFTSQTRDDSFASQAGNNHVAPAIALPLSRLSCVLRSELYVN